MNYERMNYMKNKRPFAPRLSGVLLLLAGVSAFIGYRPILGGVRLLSGILFLIAGILMLYTDFQKNSRL